MRINGSLLLALAAVLLLGAGSALAQAPPFATSKVTDNVYLFRYGGHQSIFVVTPDGVMPPIPSATTARPR